MRRDLAAKALIESLQNPCRASALTMSLPAEGSRCRVPYESARSRRSAPRSKEVARDDGAASPSRASWLTLSSARLKKEKAELEQNQAAEEEQDD